MSKQGPIWLQSAVLGGCEETGGFDEGEGGGFNMRRVVLGSRGLSSWCLPKPKLYHPEHGVKVGSGMWPSARVPGPFPLSIPPLELALLSCLPWL